jgi:hypothetical protein
MGSGVGSTGVAALEEGDAGRAEDDRLGLASDGSWEPDLGLEVGDGVPTSGEITGRNAGRW